MLMEDIIAKVEEMLKEAEEISNRMATGYDEGYYNGLL